MIYTTNVGDEELDQMSSVVRYQGGMILPKLT